MTTTQCTAFPTLTDDDFAVLEKLGTQRSFADGELLFEAGDAPYPFFAITSGRVRIVDEGGGQSREIVTHEAGHFTGDVAMLTGRPAALSAVAAGPVTALEVPHGSFRRMAAELPGISDKLLEAFLARRELLEAGGFQGLRVIGAAQCKATTELREFLYKNKVLHTFQDIGTPDGDAALRTLSAGHDDTPILVCKDHVEKKPSVIKVAECLGINRRIDDEVFDVLIIGAGPSGLAAAVYGGSEGLRTLLIDRMGPGGQAGQSSKIENYMGFPSGIKGADLADRGFMQAIKFGADFTAPVSVKTIKPSGDGLRLVELCTGQSVRTRTVLIATGASYRRLPIDGCERLEGAGVFYSATAVEARMCHNATVLVVGGGNSAGQAAMFLSENARNVKLLLRGNDLRKSMSDYLATRIENADNIEVLIETELVQLIGEQSLQRVELRNNRTGQTTQLDCPAVFLFVGAKPHTEWLPDGVALDKRGFVLTGPMIQTCDRWPLKRQPCELETTMPGVFASGDVRSGTTKRCAFAAGDGALAITCVHQHLSRGSDGD